MKRSSHDQNLMPRYLMGELSELEMEELEERYFTDDELFGALLNAQDQLIEDYRSGRLSKQARERFERRFLTIPERRREIEFAMALEEFLAERRAKGLPTPNAATVPQNQAPSKSAPLNWLRASQSAPRWAFACAALIVIFGASVAITKNSRLQEQLDQSRAQLTQQSGQNARQEDELTKPKASAVPAKAVIPVALSSDASRSSIEPGSPEATGKVRPGPGTHIIEFSLKTGAEKYPRYQASLGPANDENAKILIYKRLRPTTTGAENNVVVKTPADLLGVGDYQIKLDGVASEGDERYIGTYHFQVRR
ncbi:MAG: hypothetical protein AB7U82_11735 [Blastocatellales bacterium]